jgi:hypothetical protein
MKNITSRGLSLLLCFAVLLGITPVYAAEVSGGGEDYKEEVVLGISSPTSEGPYQTGETVYVDVLSAPDSADLYYTLDGNTPTEESALVANNQIPVVSDVAGTVRVTVLAVAEKEQEEEPYQQGAEPPAAQETEEVLPSELPNEEQEDLTGPDQNTSEKNEDQNSTDEVEDPELPVGNEEQDPSDDIEEENSSAEGEEQTAEDGSLDETSFDETSFDETSFDETAAPLPDEDTASENTATQQGGESQDDVQQGNVEQGDIQQCDESQDDAQQNGEGQNDTWQDDEVNTEAVSMTTSFMHLSSVGMSAATTLPTVDLSAENRGTENSSTNQAGEENGENTSVEKKTYTASIDIEFVDAASLLSEELALSTSGNRKIYGLSETAIITISGAQETDRFYYTTDGTDPRTSETKQETQNGTITVTSPNQDDGGAVTVLVVSAENSTAGTTSDVLELTVSFYDSQQKNEDEASLTNGDSVFYFSDVKNAFTALSDGNLENSSATLKIISEEVDLSAGSDTSFYIRGNNIRNVTLDLNSYGLKIRAAEDASVSLKFEDLDEFIITDSDNDSSALGSDGKKNEDFSQTSLVLDGVNLSNFSGTLKIINVKIDILNAKGLTVSTGRTTILQNSQLIQGSGASGTLLSLGSDSFATLENSYLESIDGSTVELAKTSTVKNLHVKTTATGTASGSLVCKKNGAIVTIEGGYYESTSYAVNFAMKATLTIDGGTYIGEKAAIRIALSSATCTIRPEVYMKGGITGKGNIVEEDCVGVEITDESSLYYGYTHYKEVTARTATTDVRDQENTSLPYVAEITATINGEPVEDFSQMKAGQQITYQVEAKQDYVLTGIQYLTTSDESIEETGTTNIPDTDYTISDDKRSLTYTMTNPDADYTIIFLVKEETTGNPIARIGETSYTSLTTAVANLKENETLTLLDSFTYSETVAFEQKNITLDLNGKTLTMDVSPESTTVGEEGAILVNGGSLTVKDSAGNGAISFNHKMVNGIEIHGNGTEFTLESGILKDVAASSVFNIRAYNTYGKVYLKGGEVLGRVQLNTATGTTMYLEGTTITADGNTSMAVYVFMAGSVEMKAGTVQNITHKQEENAVVSIKGTGVNGNSFKMTGGEIVSRYEATALDISNSVDGAVEISGNAKISAQQTAITVNGSNINPPAVKVYIKESGGKSPVIQGGTYALKITEAKYMPEVIEITGGAFSCGTDYLPISNTYYVQYPEGQVLNPEVDSEGDYLGFYTLAKTEGLGGTYYPSEGTGVQPIEYTYQDFDGARDGSGNGLRQLVDSYTETYKSQSGSGMGESWTTFVTEYEAASQCLVNKNANQMEIDYRAKKLSEAGNALESASQIDIDSLPDGNYKIQVAMWKGTLSGYSMANDAMSPTAYLNLDRSSGKLEGTLTLTFHPAYQYLVYGHLEDFYVYQGTDSNDAFPGTQLDESVADAQGLRKEAEYRDWYKGVNADQVFAKENGADEKSDEYPLPGTVIAELPYLGTSDELRSYWVGMNVDAMGGFAKALLRLSWSTIEPVGEQKDTLSVDTSPIRLIANGEQEITAKVLGSSGWTLNWNVKEGSDVVSISETEESVTVKGLKMGEAKIEVSASKGDETLPAQTIIVTIVPGTTELKPTVNVSGTKASIQITGDAVTTNQSQVEVSDDRITISVKNESKNVDEAVVEISGDACSALENVGYLVIIETDMGNVRLDQALIHAMASKKASVTLSIQETAVPSFDDDEIDRSDFKTAYDLTLTSNNVDVDFGNGTATITVPWSGRYGYAYYVDNGELKDVQTMNVSGGFASWSTDHFSTWALSEIGTLMDKVGIEEGVYSVPIVIKQADSPNQNSMANDATGDMVVADVTADGVTYTMFLKARIGDELGGGDPIRGHLIKMWYYHPDDTNLTDPISAKIVRTYKDRGMDGSIGTFPREVEVYQEGDPQSQYYIQVSVDAMGESNLQNALVKLDWDNALDDGGEAAREGFEDEYAIEQVIDSGASVSRSDLSDWIDNENILLVQGRDDDLTARFDTDALEDLYDQTSSSIKFVLEEVRTSKLTDEQQETAGDRPVYQLKLTSSGDNITDIGDGNVEVTLPYELDDGEVADGLVIWLLDEDGTHSKIKCSYSERGKTVSFDTTEFGVFVIGYDTEQIWENPFTDVKEDDWFYEAVKYVVQKGLFAGTSETTFEPNLAMTRGMLVTVLYRLEGTPAVTGSSTFADVAPGQYYTSAVIWATQNGIVSGYGNGYFGTNDIVSREQMATILFRYAKSKDYDTSLVKDIGGFTDSGQVASYAKRALQWAYANGIIGGTSETTLSPKGSATRSQVATILMRFDEKIIVPAQEKAAKEAAEAEK